MKSASPLIVHSSEPIGNSKLIVFPKLPGRMMKDHIQAEADRKVEHHRAHKPDDQILPCEKLPAHRPLLTLHPRIGNADWSAVELFGVAEGARIRIGNGLLSFNNSHCAACGTR
jgi:hypothetical protein